jgi:hypothetical protein
MSNKEFEKLCFEQFCILEFGSILDFKQLDPPHPDISLIIDNKDIGIELTTIYKDNLPGHQDSQAKKNESLHSNICNFVRNKLELALDHPYEIHIGFNDIDLSKRDVNTVGTAIVEYLMPYLKQVETDTLSTFESDDAEVFPSPIYRISGIFSPSFTQISVSGTNTSFTPELPKDRILKAMKVKEGKIQHFKDLYDKFWLLLCIQTEGPSSDFDLNTFKIPSIESDFHRVFLLQLLAKRLRRLK